MVFGANICPNSTTYILCNKYLRQSVHESSLSRAFDTTASPKYVVSLNILVTNMIYPECRAPDDARRTFGDMRVGIQWTLFLNQLVVTPAILGLPYAKALFFNRSNVWEFGPLKQKARLISSKQMLSRDCFIFSACVSFKRTSCEF